MRGWESQYDMDKAKHYRERAEEIRTIAEGIWDHKEHKILMDIAREYENLALTKDVCEGYVDLAKGPQKRQNGAEVVHLSGKAKFR